MTVHLKPVEADGEQISTGRAEGTQCPLSGPNLAAKFENGVLRGVIMAGEVIIVRQFLH